MFGKSLQEGFEVQNTHELNKMSTFVYVQAQKRREIIDSCEWVTLSHDQAQGQQKYKKANYSPTGRPLTNY